MIIIIIFMTIIGIGCGVMMWAAALDEDDKQNE